MTLLVVLLPCALLLTCLSLGAMFGARFPTRWWLLRLGLIPLICFILALYVMINPTPVAADWNPMKGANPGRLDFAAIMAWGFVLPAAYLIGALPLSLGYALWRRRK